MTRGQTAVGLAFSAVAFGFFVRPALGDNPRGPSHAQLVALCNANPDALLTPEARRKIGGEEGARYIEVFRQMHPSDRGSVLRNAALEAGIEACPLADGFDRVAGLDPETGCSDASNGGCNPVALDDRFAAAFEQRPDRATRTVYLSLPANRPLVVSSALKSVTRLVVHSKTPIDLKPVASLQALETLTIDAGPLSTLEPLRSLGKLRELTIHGVDFPERLDFSFLAGTKKLNAIELTTSGTVPHVDLAPLAALPELAKLKLQVAPDDVTVLARCKSLRELHVPARHRPSWKLGSASVTQYEQTGGDLAFLHGLVKLEVLSLWGFGATDLRPLTSLVGLRELELNYNQTLVDVAPLAALPKLEKLDLSDTAVTAPVSLPQITSISLGYLRLAHLGGLTTSPRLRSVELIGAKFDDAELAAVRKARPDIQFRLK